MENPFNEQQSQRPKFLKVLCILSFIGIGLVFVFSAFGFNKAFLSSEEEKTLLRDQQVAGLLQMNPEADEARAYEVFLKAEKFEQPNWIIGVACALLSLGGVLLMWNMKKLGYYLYVAGELISYLITFILFGSEGINIGMESAAIWGGTAEMIGLGIFASILIADVAFIILYGLNLKHLK